MSSLTERGYVAGQSKAFALTESGRNLFTRLIAQLDKFEYEQLSGISQQDLAANNLQQSWRFDWEPPKAV